MPEFYFNTNGIRTANIDFYKSDIKRIKKRWKDYMNSIEPYPDKFKGRGIVISAGGVGYFTCAWILIKGLKASGCHLPIEVWYYGNELSDGIIKELESLKVSCNNLSDFIPANSSGYLYKPLSILKSKFEEVLFLDADNYCVKNPEFLFDSNEYKEFGAIFWPDFWQTAKENPIWQISGVPYSNEKEQESGQILIHKKKCWRELNLCYYFNLTKRIYYEFLLGDKDTFRFAWHALKKDFYYIGIEPSTCGYFTSSGAFRGITMVQHSPDGEICFLHRNLLKWDVVENDQKYWEIIRSFVNQANIKNYIIGKSELGHFYMNLEGEITDIPFKKLFGRLESECLQILKDLRESKFYRDYLLYTYVNRAKTERY